MTAPRKKPAAPPAREPRANARTAPAPSTPADLAALVEDLVQGVCPGHGGVRMAADLIRALDAFVADAATRAVHAVFGERFDDDDPPPAAPPAVLPYAIPPAVSHATPQTPQTPET